MRGNGGSRNHDDGLDSGRGDSLDRIAALIAGFLEQNEKGVAAFRAALVRVLAVVEVQQREIAKLNARVERLERSIAQTEDGR